MSQYKLASASHAWSRQTDRHLLYPYSYKFVRSLWGMYIGLYACEMIPICAVSSICDLDDKLGFSVSDRTVTVLSLFTPAMHK
jgi:hypothetical protein